MQQFSRDRPASPDQRGFIPMIIMIVVALVGVMYFAFTRVLAAQQ